MALVLSVIKGSKSAIGGSAKPSSIHEVTGTTKTEAAPVLRSGNAGAIYFAVNGTAYGPAGEGASVVKNIALSQDALTETYSVANVEQDQALATYVAELQLSQ